MLVRDVMTTGVLVARETDPVRSVVIEMLRHHLRNFRRLPVVEEGRLAGMLSIGDINRGLFFALPGGGR